MFQTSRQGCLDSFEIQVRKGRVIPVKYFGLQA